MTIRRNIYSRYDIGKDIDYIPNKKYSGIAGYNGCIGWILYIFGFAVALSTATKGTVYLNRKSTIKWLNRNGYNLSKTQRGKQILRLVNAAIHGKTNLKKQRFLPNPKPQFFDLPTEISHQIFAQLSLNDLNSLQRSSKSLRLIVQKPLYVKKLEYVLKTAKEIKLKYRDELEKLLFCFKNDIFNWADIKTSSFETKWNIFKNLAEVFHKGIFNLKPDLVFDFGDKITDENQRRLVVLKLLHDLAKDFLSEEGWSFLVNFHKDKNLLREYSLCYTCYSIFHSGTFDQYLEQSLQRIKIIYPDIEKILLKQNYCFRAKEILKWANSNDHQQAIQELRFLFEQCYSKESPLNPLGAVIFWDPELWDPGNSKSFEEIERPEILKKHLTENQQKIYLNEKNHLSEKVIQAILFEKDDHKLKNLLFG